MNCTIPVYQVNVIFQFSHEAFKLIGKNINHRVFTFILNIFFFGLIYFYFFFLCGENVYCKSFRHRWCSLLLFYGLICIKLKFLLKSFLFSYFIYRVRLHGLFLYFIYESLFIQETYKLIYDSIVSCMNPTKF